MIVPVLVLMGGTYAFSAWSGSANAYFSQSAATVSFSESLSFNSTDASITPLVLSTGHSTYGNVVSTTNPFTLDNSTGGASSVLSLFVNVSNLVPGDWASFTVVVTNTGTATLNASYIHAGKPILNGRGDFLSRDIPIWTLFPPISKQHLNDLTSRGMTKYGLDDGPITAITASTAGSQSGYLQHGQSVSYNVYIILPSNAPPRFAGCSDGLFQVSLPVTVAQ